MVLQMTQYSDSDLSIDYRSDIKGHLSRFCDGFSDARLDELLGLSIGRGWWSAVTTDHLRHIVDWLKASIITEDAWLEVEG